MKILIIRHGDPDYSKDSLTEKGFREAEFLAERMAKTDIDAYYVSPLGRAQATIAPTLKKKGVTAETLKWLREFDPRIIDEETGKLKFVVWDMMPDYWTKFPEYYDKDRWYTTPVMKDGRVEEKLKEVYDGFDALLAKHGYVRENNYYRAERPNEDTIALFCHFGLECVLLSRLMNVSPVILWHGFMAAPTSVTTVVTEERREGIAYFRAGAIGDISHLYANGETPAFAGRFCEMFTNEDQRH